MLTRLNLLCGFLAIIESQRAITFFGLAVAIALADRYIFEHRLKSPFEQQFDSLAAVIVFGVTPSILLYQHVFAVFGFAGMVISFVPLMGVAMRLARNP